MALQEMKDGGYVKIGCKFWGNILITAIHNDNNEVIGFTKVTRDIKKQL